VSTFWRVTVTFFNSGVALRGQNVIWLEDPSNIKTETQIAAAMDLNFWGPSGSSALVFMTAQLVKAESYTIQKVSPAPPSGGIPVTANQVGGSQATLVLYPTVGLIFQLFDGGAGSAHRGRIYHYGTPSNLATNFIPNATAASRFATVRDTWLNAFGPLPTSGLHWCIFHRKLVGDARWTRVTDIRMAPFLHHQRRRNFATGF